MSLLHCIAILVGVVGLLENHHQSGPRRDMLHHQVHVDVELMDEDLSGRMELRRTRMATIQQLLLRLYLQHSHQERDHKLGCARCKCRVSCQFSRDLVDAYRFRDQHPKRYQLRGRQVFVVDIDLQLVLKRTYHRQAGLLQGWLPPTLIPIGQGPGKYLEQQGVVRGLLECDLCQSLILMIFHAVLIH